MSAVQWLQAQLADGPQRRDIIMKRGAAAGYGSHRLNLARRNLGIKAMKTPGGIVWAMP